MSSLYYTYADFLAEVQMSNTSYVLVEGSDDKNFFETLRLQTPGKQSIGLDLTIITAEIIRSETAGVGNRGKVEEICELIDDKPYSGKFVGFVDREFRKFALGYTIADEVGTQERIGRLVWSRGHSIENYLFDFDVIREPLYVCTQDSLVAQQALQLLGENLPEVLNIACALGIAGSQTQSLDMVRRSLDTPYLRFTNSKLHWNTEEWRRDLPRHGRSDHQTIDQIVNQFHRWLNAAQRSNAADVRWCCDGHIGIKLIWLSYAQCVYEVCRLDPNLAQSNPTNQSKTLLSISERVRFNHLSHNWVTTPRGALHDTPLLCFDLVGMTV